MSLSKGIQSAAAAALSAAMLIAVAACGTTDSTDTASKSGDSSKDSSSTSIQGFDTGSIQKDDAAPIDKLLEALKIYIIALLRLEEIDF